MGPEEVDEDDWALPDKLDYNTLVKSSSLPWQIDREIVERYNGYSDLLAQRNRLREALERLLPWAESGKAYLPIAIDRACANAACEQARAALEASKP